MNLSLLFLFSAFILWLTASLPYATSLAFSNFHGNSHGQPTLSRRHTIASLITSGALFVASPSKALEVSSLLEKVKGIPTFCIVNTAGSSYMMIDQNERMARGYAFLTFEGALAVLADAKRAAEQGGYGDVWQDATITSIPMEIAVRLALKKVDRTSQKSSTQLASRVEIIPGADDHDIAMSLDKSFRDKGRVPLFYISSLVLDDSKQPLYFHQGDLLLEWQRQNPDVAAPKIKVVDLIDLFQNALRGRTDSALPEDFVIVANQRSIDEYKELKSRGGLAPYKADKMIL